MNFADSHYMVWKENTDLTLDDIGKLADQCRDSSFPDLRCVRRRYWRRSSNRATPSLRRAA
jgi:hypothetical protein